MIYSFHYYVDLASWGYGPLAPSPKSALVNNKRLGNKKVCKRVLISQGIRMCGRSWHPVTSYYS